ncbi:MAG: hypothetical protein KKB03_03130 [Nanoarchaeota archaeon]|nr:hypothetical protein [Nanoarchaeota archaeon]
MNFQQILDYYSREDIQKAILETAENREVAGVFKNGSFGSRPNVLIYPDDIKAMVRTGTLEFHCSLEHWSNPMLLKTEPADYDKYRVGWDIVLDIDCKKFDHGKIASRNLIWALEKHGIKNFSIKYTGGTGFHIGIPWKSIPAVIESRKTLESVKHFPDVARQIGLYLKSYMKERFEKELFKKYTIEQLAEQTGKPIGNFFAEGGESLDPFQAADIDPILISSRHLFRMPYSLNRNTFLASLPIKPSELDDFEKEYAKPEKVKADLSFLKEAEKNEAAGLVAGAVDWYERINMQKRKKKKLMERPNIAISEEHFPPCINNILNGLSDGRKRSLFILINFLNSGNWKKEQMNEFIVKWNQKNKPPLRDSYVISQLRWYKDREKRLPPNCKGNGWYSDFGACQPNELCGKQNKTIKNPINYSFKSLNPTRKFRKRKK